MICVFISDVLWLTSLVPVIGGPPTIILSHSQKNISNVQHNSVNKVPGERGAVSNHFNPVSGLEPGSPAAPWDPVTVRHRFCDVWLLNCDPRGGVAALDVMSSLLLCLSLSRWLVVSGLSYQTHLQKEEVIIRRTSMGDETQNCKTEI